MRKIILASLLTFSGALTSKAEAYNYPVRVTDYGAVCSGTSDDTNGIKAAITAAGAGGTVIFPAGKCYVSGNSSIVLDNIVLVGAETPLHADEDPNNIGSEGTSILIGKVGTTQARQSPPAPQFHSFSVPASRSAA